MRTRRVAGVMLGGAALVAVSVGAVLLGDDGDGEAAERSYVVPSEAMEPTLQRGDQIHVEEVDATELQRGDIVIVRVRDPASEDEMLVIKRVVALAGDDIGNELGEMVLNGEPLDEAYLAEPTTTDPFDTVVVPAGHVFVMGDNRPNSTDSRLFGPVPAVDVEGRVVG